MAATLIAGFFIFTIMLSHSFSVSIAKEIGLKDAIILQHFVFWWQQNLLNKRNFKEGNFWTYMSRKAICETFPYLTSREVQNATDRLLKDELIEIGNFNKVGFDRTLWYAITEKTYNLFELQVDSPILQNVKWIKQNVKSNLQNVNSIQQNVNPIPDVNKDVNKDVNTNLGEETHPTNESENFDEVPFGVNGDLLNYEKEKSEIESRLNLVPLQEKKETKEKSSAKKEKKEKPVLKTMIESFPDEESFVNAWGLRFGAKYPKVDASKGYNRVLDYCENNGAKYADYVRTLLVWYQRDSNQEYNRKSYEYDSQPPKSNIEILQNLYAGASEDLW